MRRRTLSAALPLLALPLLIGPAAADELPEVAFTKEKGQVAIAVGGKPFATYVHGDAKVPRPHLAHVREPGGVQVTRNHPPVEGKDLSDHPLFHPGIWLAFGELGGEDFWRLKAKVTHDRFVEEPKGGRGQGSFAAVNHWQAAGGRTICTETCRLSVLVRPAGYLLLWESTFRAEDGEFAFGDQEEMGLGVRLATPLAVSRKMGGRILDSEGRENEKGVWGKQADWCDYSGTIDRRHVGVTLMADPANFGRSWFHARDYGLMVANPFGRNAFTRGEKSRVVVKKGEVIALRFGVLVHGEREGKAYDPKEGYKDFLARFKK